jgi:glycosyltransferase involved in cell wall biosynthesis
MKVLMVTPHLPPHQAANALLPHLLGEALEARGHRARYLTWGGGPDTASVAYVKRRPRLRALSKLPQALEAVQTWQKSRRLLAEVDVAHIHSSTWVNQVLGRLCAHRGTPYVLTHYGTEIWHHDGRDRTFRSMNRRACHVAFYSQALLERARALDLPMAAASVVYPPVPPRFQPVSPDRRAELRRRYVPPATPLLLNVKRLHPLADQKTLLRALARVRAERPEVRLLVAGAGEAEPALRALAAELDLGQSVRFLGLVPNDEVAELQAAADLFVLSSVLEATPTVVLEALACGTPVVSTDNPGGVELQAFFRDDLRVVPRQDPERLAGAVLEFLKSPRRAGPDTERELEDRFRLDGVASRYLELYAEACRR